MATTNRALAMATGDVVAFLDNDDELVDVAVERVLATFAADPSIGIAYSDEYLIDQDGHVIAPYDKPDFSPERLRSHNYFAHLVAVDREYAVASGGLREGFDGAQDNDFDFRAVEHFGGATHIPERLYRWRAIAGSVADDPAAKPSTLFSAERALREHLERTGIDATTSPARDVNFSFRLHRTLRGTPLVSFVVRTDDGSIPPLVGDAIRRASGPASRSCHVDGAGAAAVNAAVEAANGELVVIVDGDLRLARGDLIRDLLPLAQDDDVAAVGPTLAPPRRPPRRQRPHVRRRSAHRSATARRSNDIGPWGIYRVTREVSAIPAVCFAARRDTFLEARRPGHRPPGRSRRRRLRRARRPGGQARARHSVRPGDGAMAVRTHRSMTTSPDPAGSVARARCRRALLHRRTAAAGGPARRRDVVTDPTDRPDRAHPVVIVPLLDGPPDVVAATLRWLSEAAPEAVAVGTASSDLAQASGPALERHVLIATDARPRGLPRPRPGARASRGRSPRRHGVVSSGRRRQATRQRGRGSARRG